MSKAKNSKDKGKQRASAISLVPSEFLKSQIDALNAPLDDLACEDYTVDDDPTATIDQKVLDKAVKVMNKQLVTARSKKLPDSALDAIAEQLQYLRAQQQGAVNDKQATLDQDGTIGVDREYWLESLPAEWPEDDEAEQDLRQQYAQLVASTRALKSKQRILEQKTAHYERLLALLEDEVDLETLTSFLGGSTTAKHSAKQSGKRKKRVEDSEEERDDDIYEANGALCTTFDVAE